jgi:hypothetical protein
MHRLFIREDKAYGVTQTEIDKLEGQVFEACIDHLSYSDREHMYAVVRVR